MFKDFGKAAKDLLGKNYGFGENKIEVESSGGDAGFDTSWSSKGSSKVETHFKKLPNNTSLDIECASNANVTATLKMKDLFPGATVKTKAGTATNMFVGLEYVQDAASLTADVDIADSPVFNVSALFSQAAFTCGGSIKATQDAGLAEYALGVGYGEKKSFEVTAKLSETVAPKPKPLSLLVQYIHHVTPSASLGASFNRSMTDSPTSTTALGGTYKMEGGTKLGLKIDSDSKLGAHAIHQLKDGFTLTQCLQLDVKDMKAPHKFGINLKYKPQ